MTTTEINRAGISQQRLLVAVAIVAFVLNYLWEMLQMPFFANMGFANIRAWGFCFLATIGDMIIILFILALGKWLFGHWCWPEKLNVSKIMYLLFAGLSIGIITESVGIGFNWWEYNHRMLLLPYFETGLAPLVQMLLLPLLSFKITLHRICIK